MPPKEYCLISKGKPEDIEASRLVRAAGLDCELIGIFLSDLGPDNTPILWRGRRKWIGLARIKAYLEDIGKL